ncbi:MAG: hypothetical protein JWO30_1384 [Fibrobacteres bacterium]|nr:hypothetical protein [Fibrobacterota bacterium]
MENRSGYLLMGFFLIAAVILILSGVKSRSGTGADSRGRLEREIRIEEGGRRCLCGG